MPSFKNVSAFRVDLPALDLHVEPGDTFTVDDPGFAAGLAQQPLFEAVSDIVPDAAAPIPVAPAVDAAPSPAPVPDATSVDFTSN